MWAGREFQTRTRPRSSMSSPSLRHVDEIGLEVGLAAHLERVNARAVHRVFDLVFVLEAAHDAEIRPEHLDGELIFAVERQRHPGENPADGADGACLRGECPAKRPDGCGTSRSPARIRIADRQRADLARGVHVALEQHGRNAEHVADVVEAVGGVVRRQQRRGIDIERQQIANGVRVLGAVQAVQHGPSGIGLDRGRPIERIRKPGDELAACRGVRLRRALRRHHPDAHFPDGLFPDAGLRGDVRIVHVVERQPAALRALVVAAGAVPIHGRAGVYRR